MNKPVDMSLSKADLKKREGTYPVAVGESGKDGPKFPWGLEIRLDETSLKKLGMDGELPEVGELCQIAGVGRVVAVEERESQDRSSKNVTIQIERLNLEVKEGDSEKEFEDGARRGSGRNRPY